MSRALAALVGVALVLPLSSAALSSRQGVPAGAGRAGTGPGAIVGRVLDPSGHPVPDVFVTALRPLPSGLRPFTPVSVLLRSLTNAQGEFRLDGLFPGEFYLVALPHNPVLGADGQLSRSGYGKTFYPGAGDVRDAKPVVVTASTPGRADITLAPARLSVISGTVIGSNGQPARGGSVGVAHGDNLFGLDGRALSIRPDGLFVASSLPPGTYFLEFHVD